MNEDKEFKRVIHDEFRNTIPNLIWQEDDGSYEVFYKYRIIPEKPVFRVFCSASDIGVFSSTKTALSWCIADKFKNYNLARNILQLDNKLTSLINDINVRAKIGDKSNQPLFRETIGTKLETKIIHKKKLENELVICVNRAKYLQQQGFNNETVRTVRTQTFKASR
jgi:hypothetical protein